jgi:phosphohistidine phosphatase SixA
MADTPSNVSYGAIEVPSSFHVPRRKTRFPYAAPTFFLFVLIAAIRQHSLLKQRNYSLLMGSPSNQSTFSLLLLRHANVAEENTLAMSDFEKPLDQTGESEAIWVGKMLRKAHIPPPDSVFSSASLRTRETLDLVATHAQWEDRFPPVQYATAWYDLAFDGNHGYRDYLADVLRSSPFRRVMVVGHNPAIELLVNQLLPIATFIQVPSGSLIEIQFTTMQDWGEIRNTVGAMALFLNPLNRNSQR